jgi:hypothetical protein
MYIILVFFLRALLPSKYLQMIERYLFYKILLFTLGLVIGSIFRGTPAAPLTYFGGAASGRKATLWRK